MNHADEMVGGLLVTLASSVVLGIAALLIVYKTIDGDIPGLICLGALTCLVGVLMLTVKPPHPAIPAIVLVIALTLMAGFPFALNQLDKADFKSYELGRMGKAYDALRMRPDNFSAKFEIARRLHAQGLVHHAIAITATTLDGLSANRDPLTNRSLRDQFREEDYKLQAWMRTAGSVPLMAAHTQCKGCGHTNQLSSILCEKCGNAYLLAATGGAESQSRVIGKLVMTWGLLALYLVGSAAISVNLSGALSIVVILVALGGLGGILYWLFRPALGAA